MIDILNQEPSFRVSADPRKVIKSALAESSQPIAERFKRQPSPIKIVLAKMDGAICDELTSIAELVAPVESKIINEARKRGQIDKARQIYLHFHVLLKIHGLDMETLTRMIAERFSLFPSVTALKERLVQRGVGMVAVSNGMGVFLRAALKMHHLDLPVICNELVFDEGGGFAAIEVLHDPVKLIDQGQVFQTLKELGAVIVGCIGDGPSDIPMAREVSTHGGYVLSCGARSPLTGWCKEHLSKGDYGVYERSVGFVKDVRDPLLDRASYKTAQSA